MFDSPSKKGYSHSPTRDHVITNYRDQGVEQVIKRTLKLF